MAFSFGNVGTKTKPKVLQDSNMSTSFKLVNNFNPDYDYYLFLLEGVPKNYELNYINSEIQKAGYKSYIIATSTVAPYDKDKVKQVYEHMMQYASGWRELVCFQGKRASGIMVFGPSIYAVNKGTDIMVDCFYDMWMNKPYYYMGHGYVGDFDTFIFPVDMASVIYPSKDELKGRDVLPINWKTRFFLNQLKNMLGKKEKPDDMSEFRMICSTDELDSSMSGSGRRIQHKAKDILTSLMNSDYLSWDTETTGLRWYRNDLVCITLCNDGKTGYYIPWSTIKKDPELCKLLVQVFYTAKHLIGANVKFDFHFIWDKLPGFDFNELLSRGVEIDDICQLAHCINSDRTKSLKSQTYFYTPFGGYDHELDVFKSQTGINNYGQIPTKILYPYATTDAIMTWRIFFSLKKHVRWIDEHYPITDDKPKTDDWNMENWYDNLLKVHYPDYIVAEHTGMNLDRDFQLKVREALRKRKAEYTEKLSKTWNVPIDFDFCSTKKLGKLIEDMGWPKVLESKDGGYATSDDCIQEWKRQKRPGIDDLITLRETISFLGTFIGEPSPDGILDNATGWEQFVIRHPEDNSYRVHQSYQVGGTETFRNIGQEPNLQNCPSHGRNATDIKRCITVPTSLHYKIESDDGNIYEGGELDTVEVVGKGRITLDSVVDTDSIVPNSLQKYDTSKFDSYFESGEREF